MRTRFQSLLKRTARPSEPDAELVRRFAASGDQAAFAELVRRYGRLVWSQCRNLLANETDADDAFQATFLTLAKSAKAVRQADRLGPWLHGVAYKVCQNAKRVAARRTKRERGSAAKEATRPVADSAWDSALAAVHDELHRLPEPLRVAFVLCCLEGKGVSEAAGQLGLKLGTFSARLTRAKQALMDRLTARGLTAGVVALAAVTGGAATAPAKVVDRAVELATMAGAVPANILSLTHGVLTMGTWNVKLLAAAVLVAGGLTAGFGGAFTATAQEPGKEKAAKDADRNSLENQKLLLELRRAEMFKKLAPDNPLLQEVAAKIELVKAEQERIKETVAPEKKSQSEFKYYGQTANFAPTADELETLVKRGEEGGYRFVGITPMKGMTKQGDAAVPTLVFRRAKLIEVHADSVLDKVKGLKDLGDVTKGLELKGLDLKKGIELDMKELVELKKGVELKHLDVQELKKAAEAKAQVLELEMKNKVKDQVAKADAEAKAADAMKKRMLDDERAKLDAVRQNRAADPAAREAEKLKAEIEALRAQIAVMEAKTAKKPATMSAKFTVAELGGGVISGKDDLVRGMIRLKFGDDVASKFNVTTHTKPDELYVSVYGDPEVVKWLQDAVKILRDPAKSDKPK